MELLLCLLHRVPGYYIKTCGKAKGKKKNQLDQTLLAAFFMLLFIGLCLFSLLFFGSKVISGWMGDPLLAPLIKMTSFIFLLLPFLSVGRGYFQGIGNMIPTAASQITEQFVRVASILLVSALLIRSGYSLYDTGEGAIAGSIIGGIAGLGLLTLFIVRQKGFRLQLEKGLSFREHYHIGKIILLHGTAICFSGMLLVLFQLIDSFNLYALLLKAGTASEHAKTLKGVFDRGQPLLQLGTVAASSLSLALVPLVASAWMRGEKEIVRNHTNLALKISVVIGTGATIGLINIMKPTNTMLFEDSAGSVVLAVLSMSIFFSSIIITCAGILHGLGHVFAPAKYILIGMAVKLCGNYLFIPVFGTMGAAISTVIGLLIITLFLVWKLNKKLKVIPVFMKLLRVILPAIAIMTLVLQLWMLLLELAGLSGRLWNGVAALTGVGFGGVAYLAIILRSSLLSEEEINRLPFGHRLNQLIRKKAIEG